MEPVDKKGHILKTAEKLFARQGFSGTSVRDIAQEAGINIAMISYYFGSKEKLMEAVFEMKTAHVRFQIEALLKNEELSPEQKVNLLIDQYVEKVIAQPEFHRIMAREQLADKNTVIASIINEMRKRNLEIIRKLIQDGQKKKAFRKNVDVPMIMNTLFGTVNYTMNSQEQYRSINQLEDMPEEEFQQHLKKKLSSHLKMLFKAILTYEI